MIVLNHKERILTLIHAGITSEEEKGYLVDALLATIYWNGSTEYGSLYNKSSYQYNDGQNLCEIVHLIERLNKTIVPEEANLKIIIPTASPDEVRQCIYRAIVASTRWYGSSNDGCEKTKKDANNLIAIAKLLEQFSEIQIIE